MDLSCRETVLSLVSWGGYLDMVKTVVNGASEGEIPDCTIAFELASWQ